MTSVGMRFLPQIVCPNRENVLFPQNFFDNCTYTLFASVQLGCPREGTFSNLPEDVNIMKRLVAIC